MSIVRIVTIFSELGFLYPLSEKERVLNMEKENQKIEDSVNMYVLFARFFSIAAEQLEKDFGQKGLDSLGEIVRTFGYLRGKDIARRAAEDGKENSLLNYLSSYDMERSELFGYENDIKPETVNQVFHKCVFAETWIGEGKEQYGRIYCENIDPSIAKGYNEDMICEHDHIMYDHGECTFCFKMKEK